MWEDEGGGGGVLQLPGGRFFSMSPRVTLNSKVQLMHSQRTEFWTVVANFEVNQLKVDSEVDFEVDYVTSKSTSKSAN